MGAVQDAAVRIGEAAERRQADPEVATFGTEMRNRPPGGRACGSSPSSFRVQRCSRVSAARMRRTPGGGATGSRSTMTAPESQRRRRAGRRAPFEPHPRRGPAAGELGDVRREGPSSRRRLPETSRRSSAARMRGSTREVLGRSAQRKIRDGGAPSCAACSARALPNGETVDDALPNPIATLP